MSSYCQGCGRRRRFGEWGCPSCGAEVYAGTVPGSVEPIGTDPAPLRGILEGLVALPPGNIALVHGPRGVGKTSVVLAALERPWVVTAEMEPELLQAYAQRIGVQLAGISVPEWIVEEESERLDMKIRSREACDVIFDSLTAAGRPAEALAAVRTWCRARSVRGMVIVQQTKDGSARGPATLGFDVDVEIRLDYDGANRVIVVEKNRFGALGTKTYSMSGGAPGLPTLDRYYSVEGENGSYRLVAYPGHKSRYDGYLRAVEANRLDPAADSLLRLPKPPVAVAAQACALYPCGWIEPPDVQERKSFANRHNIPYYSPFEKES